MGNSPPLEKPAPPSQNPERCTTSLQSENSSQDIQPTPIQPKQRPGSDGQCPDGCPHDSHFHESDDDDDVKGFARTDTLGASADAAPLASPLSMSSSARSVEDFLSNDLDAVDARAGHRLSARSSSRSQLQTPTRTVQYARCSIKGSRSRNEDNHGTVLQPEYTFSFVCDGHGGAELADVLGEAFKNSMKTGVAELPVDASPKVLVNCLKAAYREAVKAVDHVGNVDGYETRDIGSTITAILLQQRSMRLAVLQLGDCRAVVCNARTGEVADAQVLLYIDAAVPNRSFGSDLCITPDHNWGDKEEHQRFEASLGDKSKLNIWLRRDAMRGEERYLAGVQGVIEMDFNEPSRSVESLEFYPTKHRPLLAGLQRAPEYVVWQLPETFSTDLLIFVCCDGFVSHNCMPSLQAVARCISDPETYMEGVQCLDGTCMHGMVSRMKDTTLKKHDLLKWKLTADNPEWTKDATNCCYNVVHRLAPDDVWKEAVQMSWDSIQTIRNNNNGRVPAVIENPQGAVQMATNLAVLMMSDDNVTLEALLVSSGDH